MPANDYLRQTLEHYLQQQEKKLEELRELEVFIRGIRRELGEEEGSMEELPLFGSLAQKPAEQGAAKEPEVRVDEFLGMTQSDAAKIYLKKIGHAVSMDQLVTALKRGACKVGGVDPKKTLYISLVRNVRDFIPVQSGYIGLREFYPHLKAGTTNKTKKPKPKKKHHKSKAVKTRGKKNKKEAVKKEAVKMEGVP